MPALTDADKVLRNDTGKDIANKLNAIADAIAQGGGGGSSTLAGLNDVNLTSPSNEQVLKYNSTTRKWENADESGGGGTSDYNNLSNKPQINSVSLQGNKSLDDLGIQSSDIIDQATGSIATFDNGGNTAPVKSLTTQIIAKQDGSGVPAPDNIRPITGIDSINVYVSSKNFAAMTEASGSHNGITYTFNDDGTVSARGQVPSGNSYKNYGHFTLKPGTYTISGMPNSSPTSSRYWAIVLCKNAYSGSVDIIKTIYSNISVTDSFKLTEITECYMRIYVYSGVGAITNVTFSPQVELGEEATEYDQHKGSITHIVFPETIYEANTEFTNGPWIKTKEHVDLGDLTYTYDATYTRMWADIPHLKAVGAVRLTPFICSCFQSINDGRDMSDVPNDSVYAGAAGTTKVYFKTTETDPDVFKTNVTGQTLLYPIEPEAILISPIKILTVSGLNNIYTNYSDITVEYFNKNSNSIAELVESYGSYIEIIGTLTAGQTSITFTDSRIKMNSTIDVYTDSNIDYNSIISSEGSITIAFDAQENDLGVKVRLS